MKGFAITGFFFFLVLHIYAQEFGGHPPSQKWFQINTDTARIIFPSGLDSQARRVASVIHTLAAKNAYPLGSKLYKINIVLQNQTVTANGYVGLGPYRSEFFLTPDASSFQLGSLPWADQLAVHEYRHVQQYNNFRNGLSKVAWHLFGEEGLLVAAGAAVPDWFYEGDAVFTETMLTNQGRGRIPFFLNGYEALWRAGKDYNWMKLRNGSLKDYVPDHYQLGYLLVNYGYQKYGPDFWEKVTHDASAYRGLVYPFQQAIRRYAGISYQQFREQAFRYYQQQHSITAGEVIATQGTMLRSDTVGIENITALNKRYVTQYLFPYEISDTSLLYEKKTYRSRPAFTRRKDGVEKKIRVRDISQDEQFGYRNGKIVYAAYIPDARWGWRSYSDLRMLDIFTGKQVKLTHHTKYFSPDISENGEHIVAVHLDPKGSSALHLLNTAGRIEKIIPAENGIVFTDPKWVDDVKLVAGQRLADGTMRLVLVNTADNSLQPLTPGSYNVLGNPSVQKGIVYFTASYEGDDEIYAVDISDKKVFKITKAPLGNYFVHAGRNALLWSALTAEGFQLRKQPWKDVVKAQVNPMALQETGSVYPIHNMAAPILQQVTDRQFNTSKYPKSTGLFNFHSWRPYFEDPVFSFSVYGENVLNTLQTELYYAYNQNENTSATGFNLVYGGLFPYLGAGMEYTFDRTVPANNSTRNFNQLDTRVGFSIPLNLTAGRSFNFLNFGSSFVLRNEFNIGSSKNQPANDFSYLSHFINWSQQAQMARQHIYPRWGYALNAGYRHAITNITGYQVYGNSHLYLPGFANTHSIVLQGALQQRDTASRLFSNRFPFSRGYNEPYLSRMWRGSANYHLPLIYPDRGVANIVYFERIRANLFYDFTRVFSNSKLLHADFRSAGLEIFADTKWWNEYPLTFGIRYAHLLDPDLLNPLLSRNRWEIVLPVSILPK